MKSYLQAKRRFILNETPHEHLMVVPGKKTEELEGGAERYGRSEDPW